MNFRHLAAGLALLVGLMAGCTRAPQQLSDAHAAAIRDSVQAMLQVYRDQVAAKEWDSVASLYADDPHFRWVEDGVVRYRSAAEIRQALAALPPSMRVETTYDETEIVPLAPGVASVLTRFETRFVDSTGAGFGFGGAITITLMHREGGWRFLSGHSSSPKRRGP